MRKLGLIDFFKAIGYDYKKDLQVVSDICYYTKTRVKPVEFKMSAGCEQPFILKALAEKMSVVNFFEIGTGRGTASYSVALVPSVKEVITIDIIPYTTKLSTAIGNKKVVVSNKDIFKMIKYKEKSKIKFKERKPFWRKESEQYKNYFDLCFVDGEHSKEDVILSDYEMCKKVLKPKGIILFDDYNPKFPIKNLVDKILEAENLDAILVEFHGHLFGGEPEKDSGLVIIKEGKLDI